MKALSALVALLVSVACVPAGLGQSDGGLRLRYSLTEGSNMAVFPRSRPPRLRRSLSGTFDVVVRERFEGGFVFEIMDLEFRSIEDDLFEIQTNTGLLIFRDLDFDLDLQMSLNGEEQGYRPAMRGADRMILATTWPPVFRNFGMLSFENAQREEYWIHVYAEAHFCPADCNQDGTSTIDEIIVCLDVALGAPPQSCPTCDLNGDGRVSIDEIVSSVDTLLHGCSE